MPSCYKIESRNRYATPRGFEILELFRCSGVVTKEGRIAEDIGLGSRIREYVCPIKLQGVAVDNVGGNLNWQPLRRPAYRVRKLFIRLVVD